MEQEEKKDENKDDATKKPEDSSGIKNWDEVKKIIADRDALKAQLKSINEEFSQLSEYKQKTEAQKQKEAAEAEKKKLEESGKYEEALNKVTSEYEEKFNKTLSSLQKKLIPSAIKSAAAKVANIDPTAIDDLPKLLDNVRMDPSTMDVFVVDEQGNPLKDDKLRPVGLEEYVKSFVESRPRMLLDSQTKGSGFKPGAKFGDAKVSLSDVMNDPEALAEWQEKDPESYRAAISKEFFGPKMIANIKKRYEK